MNNSNPISVTINGRKVGPGHPVYIVAEISANHGHSFDQALRTLRAAKECGADAVKLQTYTPDTLTIPSKKEYFWIGGGTLWDGRTLYELYGEAYTPWEWQPKLKRVADELNLTLFSSAFDSTAVDFLEKMGVPAHKVASFEIVDIPLIEKMASTGKPLIISTGMASHDEIHEAIMAARKEGTGEVVLLKCTSAYPAPAEGMNLLNIPKMARKFNAPIGLSDHTLGTTVPIAAVVLGACVVEKHFTISRALKGPDSAFSLEPAEFKTMVDAIRMTEKALGAPKLGPTDHERKNLVFRRSLFVVKNMKAGETFTCQNIRSIRPAYGLPPKHFNKVIGKRASHDLEEGTPLQWDDIQVENKKLELAVNS